jgi:hypothetical protein
LRERGEGGRENTLIPIIISDHTKSLMSQEKIKHVHTEREKAELEGKWVRCGWLNETFI